MPWDTASACGMISTMVRTSCRMCPGHNRLSPYYAEYLSVHPYFNPKIPLEEEQLPTIKLISPRAYPAGSKNVSIQLRVSDSEGLYQVLLLLRTRPPHPAAGSIEVKTGRRFTGEKDAVVEFDYDGVIPSDDSTSLSNPVVQTISVEAIDINGNVGQTDFVLFSKALQPLSKISGDNQHGLPNTPLPLPFIVELRDLNDGSARRKVSVTFTVTAGGGTLSVDRAETNYRGRAESTLTLGPNLGTNTVEVSAAGLTVTFNAVAGAPVDIPDANLRAMIEDALGKAPGTPIAPSEMATLTSLEASNANISNLTGLELATNLTRLELGPERVANEWRNSNSVKDLSPLAGLTQLTRLHLPNNSISDVSAVAGLTNLSLLNLSGNDISDISAVVGLTKLTALWVNGNSISDISPLAGLTKLTRLELDNNSISDISALAGLTNLTTLRLDRNSISDISVLSSLTHLTELRLDRNSITDLSPLAANTGLGSGDTVDVRGNSLSYLSIHTHIPTLQNRGVTVEFDNRTPANLLTISGVITELDNLLIIEVRDSNGLPFEGVPVTFTITSGGGTLSVTRTMTDENGRAESRLTLRSGGGTNTVRASVEGISESVTFSNVAADIPDPNLRAAIEGALGKIPGTPIAPAEMAALSRLEARNANISNLTGLESATNLTRLELGPERVANEWRNSNSVKDLSPLAGLIQLTWLHLPNNSLSDISAVANLPRLTWLHFSHNNISDLSSLVANTGLGKGDKVYVRGNPLSYLSINTHLPMLQERGVEIYFDNRAHPALLKISGENQKGASFAPLSQPFVIEAQDENGSALTGISVRFAVTAGGGTLSTTITRTDKNGRTQSTLTLGPNIGINTVSVSAVGIEGLVVFNAISDAESPPITADVNSDGSVNVLDLVVIASELGNEGTNLVADVNRDEVVNILDLILVAGMFEGAAAAPSAQPQVSETFTAVEVQGWLTNARSLEAKDPIMKRGFVVLEQLLVSLTPTKTELLSNYPNPFNPETWIPYRLAEGAFVTLTIYDGSGRVVRTLDVGHRIASAYESRSKAVYWDGRNDVGERVASGVYFYTLMAGDYSATRKMVILK